MPKRGAIALLLTAGALAFLLSFRTPETTTASRPAQVTAAPAAGAPGTSAPPRAQPQATAGARAVPRAQPPTTAGASAAPRPTGTVTTLRDGTYTGDSIRIRWGNVQVQVTVSGGRIAEIAAVDMPYSDRRTQRITDVAEPILREQALQIQGSAVDTISGATFTCRAYAGSLQSALDQAAGS